MDDAFRKELKTHFFGFLNTSPLYLPQVSSLELMEDFQHNIKTDYIKFHDIFDLLLVLKISNLILKIGSKQETYLKELKKLLELFFESNKNIKVFFKKLSDKEVVIKLLIDNYVLIYLNLIKGNKNLKHKEKERFFAQYLSLIKEQINLGDIEYNVFHLSIFFEIIQNSFDYCDQELKYYLIKDYKTLYHDKIVFNRIDLIKNFEHLENNLKRFFLKSIEYLDSNINTKNSKENTNLKDYKKWFELKLKNDFS